jgi:hypothetical protein
MRRARPGTIGTSLSTQLAARPDTELCGLGRREHWRRIGECRDRKQGEAYRVFRRHRAAHREARRGAAVRSQDREARRAADIELHREEGRLEADRKEEDRRPRREVAADTPRQGAAVLARPEAAERTQAPGAEAAVDKADRSRKTTPQLRLYQQKRRQSA